MERVFGRPQGLTELPFHYCPGCTHGIIHRLIGEVLEELDIVGDTIGVAPVGCAGFSLDFFSCDFVGAAHGRAQAVATGIKRSKPEQMVFTYQGDGDIAAIGTSHAIHVAARGEKITSIMVNNAVFGMTGGQMAPTTLPGVKTETTPYGRDCDVTGYPTKGPEMVAAVAPEGAYIARGTVANPRQLKGFIKKALENQIAGRGISFVECLSGCPTNWRTNAKQTWEYIEKDMAQYFKVGELRVPQSKEG